MSPTPGSVVDRQHRKWEEAAVELAHNPYSRYTALSCSWCKLKCEEFHTNYVSDLVSTTGSVYQILLWISQLID